MTMPSPLSAQDGSLLLYCLGVRRPEWEGIDRPMLTDSDWAEIFRQAGGNGVTSLLYHRLRRHRPLVPIPPVALEHLWDASVRSAAQSLRLGRELAQVLAALRHHRVPVVVLKGAHLGQLVYPSAALRTMCDIDVLVGREDLTRATAILSGLGYAPQYYNVEEVDYTQHHHLRPMARPDGVRVEIHWTHRAASPAVRDRPERAVGAGPAPRRSSGAEVLVLSPEDLHSAPVPARVVHPRVPRRPARVLGYPRDGQSLRPGHRLGSGRSPRAGMGNRPLRVPDAAARA